MAFFFFFALFLQYVMGFFSCIIFMAKSFFIPLPFRSYFIVNLCLIFIAFLRGMYCHLQSSSARMKDSRVLSGSGGGGGEERSWCRSVIRRVDDKRKQNKNPSIKRSQNPFLVLYNFSNFSILTYNKQIKK